jgi:hypothetical protein
MPRRFFSFSGDVFDTIDRCKHIMFSIEEKEIAGTNWAGGILRRGCKRCPETRAGTVQPFVAAATKGCTTLVQIIRSNTAFLAVGRMKEDPRAAFG